MPASGADGVVLSEEGPGHYNPDRSEDPWGKAATAACTVVRQCTAYPDLEPGTTLQAAGRTKGGSKPPDVKESRSAGRPVGNTGLEAVLGKTHRTEF